jgi:hypothetical protein
MSSSIQVATRTKAPKANDGTLKLRGDGGTQTTKSAKSKAGSTKDASQSPDKKKAIREKAIAKLRDELGMKDFAPSIADLTSKSTDTDHLNYAKSELRDLWKSVFGDKDIPDTIATNAEFKDTQITDDFRSQVDMIKSIATAHTDMIQKYEKYTGGYVSRLVKDKLRAIPTLAAASTSSALTVKSSTPQTSVKSTDVTIPNSPQTDTAVSVSKADKRKMAEAALARQAKSKKKDTASTSSAVTKSSKKAKTDTSSSAVGTKSRKEVSALSTTDKDKVAKALAKKQASKTSKGGTSAATQANSTASGKSTKTSKTKEERKAEGLANLKKWKAESEAAKSQSSAASTTIPNGTSAVTSDLKKTGTSTTAGRTELPADVMEKIRKMNADLKPVMEARSDYAELTARSSNKDWATEFEGLNKKWEATLAAKLDKMKMTQNADGTVSRTITESVSPSIVTTMTDLGTGAYTERVYQVRNAADTKPAFSIDGGGTATGQTSQASSLKFPFKLDPLKKPSTSATVPTSSLAPASAQPTNATTSAAPTSLAASTLGAASDAASSITQTVKDAASSAVSTAKDTIGLGSESASTSLTDDQKRQAMKSLQRRSSKSSSKGGSGRTAPSSASRTRASSGVSKAKKPGSSGSGRLSKAPSSSRATSAG